MATGGGKIRNAGIALTVSLTFEMSWYFALSMQTFVDCWGGIVELQLSMAAGSVVLLLKIKYEPTFPRTAEEWKFQIKICLHDKDALQKW